jgi:pullulanase/glycogen debranching enzyme
VEMLNFKVMPFRQFSTHSVHPAQKLWGFSSCIRIYEIHIQNQKFIAANFRKHRKETAISSHHPQSHQNLGELGVTHVKKLTFSETRRIKLLNDV